MFLKVGEIKKPFIGFLMLSFILGFTGNVTAYDASTEIESSYSSIIMNRGGLEVIDYRISNNNVGESKYRSEIKNLNSTFVENNKKVINKTLNSGESKELKLRVTPGEGLTGERKLKIVTENLETGVRHNSSINVLIRENARTTERPVFAPGLTHLLVLMITTFLVYFRRGKLAS